ncbi:MAG: Uma2 family endonuclease [Ktedonobacterales bacterium]
MRESMAPDVRARFAALLPAAGQMSIDELMALPEHRWRYELIAGQLTQRLPNDLQYDMIQSLLVSALRRAIGIAGIEGVVVQETGVVVSAADQPDTMFVPALAFIQSSQLPVSGSAAEVPSVRLVPKFVVEIAAPGQEGQALADRVRTWMNAGTQIVWVIWPARRQVDVWRGRQDVPLSAEADTVEVTIRNVHNTLELEDLLPGFTYPVGHLFS